MAKKSKETLVVKKMRYVKPNTLRNALCGPLKKRVNKMLYPKKSKLIVDGGFYRIVPTELMKKEGTPVPVINFPIMKRVKIYNVFHDISLDTSSYSLEFSFCGIKGGYCEYKQSRIIELKNDSND